MQTMKSEELDDSPRKSSSGETKPDKSSPQTAGSSSAARPAPKYALLESLAARFSLQEEERKRRIEAKRSRMEMEVVHSQYLRRHVADPGELETAGLVASIWAHKHGTVERTTNKLVRKRGKGNCSNNAIDPPFPSPMKKPCPDSASGPSGRRQSFTDSCVVLDDSTETSPGGSGGWLKGTPGHYVCPVGNCGCVLSCREELKRHLSHSSHSPCNPCRYMPECRLPPFPLCYMCPYCEDPAKMRVEVAEHMVMTDHLPIFSPIAVIAFICPECLNLFPDCVDCHKHIQDCHHTSVAIPFAEDLQERGPWEEQVAPTVPVGLELAQDYVAHCAAVPSTLTCLTCNRLLTGPQEVWEHLEMTSGSHVITAQASVSLVDVLLEYFASGKMCTECLQIMQAGSELMEGVHKCAPGKFGIIDDMQCSSFHNFVRSCSFFFSERKIQGQQAEESAPSSPARPSRNSETEAVSP